MTAEQRISCHLPKIVHRPDKLIISDTCKVTICCNNCNTEVVVSVRNLARKWINKPYLCKSCHVKSYVSSENRLAKFKRSFDKTARTVSHKQKCSDAAKKLWSDPVSRLKIKEAVKEDNHSNPKKILARQKASIAWMRQYGRKKLSEMREAQRSKASILEDIFAAVLTQNNIIYERQYSVGYYHFDFHVPSHNCLVEVNGEYWHKDTGSADSAKATYASNLGYIVKHLWEQEFSEMGKIEAIVREWFGAEVSQVDFSLRNVAICEVSNIDARKFLGQYHYLPAIAKSGYHIGARLEDKLIACVTFSWVVRQETAIRLGLSQAQVREVGRFCIATGYNKRNFASWFLTKAVKLFRSNYPQVVRLVSFADTSMHEGTIYVASGWVHTGQARRSYSYKSTDGYLVHKKTVWDRAKKLRMTESEYADAHNYIKVWSKVKKRYEFEL